MRGNEKKHPGCNVKLPPEAALQSSADWHRPTLGTFARDMQGSTYRCMLLYVCMYVVGRESHQQKENLPGSRSAEIYLLYYVIGIFLRARGIWGSVLWRDGEMCREILYAMPREIPQNLGKVLTLMLCLARLHLPELQKAFDWPFVSIPGGSKLCSPPPPSLTPAKLFFPSCGLVGRVFARNFHSLSAMRRSSFPAPFSLFRYFSSPLRFLLRRANACLRLSRRWSEK